MEGDTPGNRIFQAFQEYEGHIKDKNYGIGYLFGARLKTWWHV